mgnify:CR=1 FL=1
MPSHLRFQSQKWATHHVVSRCLQGFAFLKPNKQIRAITKGVFGYALNKYEEVIKLHHYVFLSNHFHLILSAETSRDLAEFMCFFKGNLARELARIHNWHGTMWQKRYSSEEILDEAGLQDIFKYLTKNSVKEGLVDHPRKWRGLHGYHQLVMKKSVSGPWIDRTGHYWAKQRREEVTLEDFTTKYEIKLTPPPLWSDLSKLEYVDRCRNLSEEAIQEALRDRKHRQSMGMKKVLRENIYKTRFTKRGTRPLCRTKCIKALKAYQKLYFEFKARFQEVSADLRQAIHLGLETASICFPAGGVPMFGGRYSPD